MRTDTEDRGDPSHITEPSHRGHHQRRVDDLDQQLAAEGGLAAGEVPTFHDSMSRSVLSARLHP
jgi:hypothetical protein